ncbi:MAG: NAD-dependent epimerase/dehydratase family protein [Ginsengibacter sp.]
MDKLLLILGAKGFLGSYLHSYFEAVATTKVIPLYRPLFDICDKATYEQLPPDKELLLFDAITVNNWNKTDIKCVNIHGHKNFIDWLNSNNRRYHYVYFSTLSTLKISEHLANDYIVSKFIAENYIKEHCKNYTIIRVSFLFGKGENKNRLLSRIINKVQMGEDIQVDDVFLNLTPVGELGILFKNNEFLKSREINFIDGVTYRLQELVSIITEKINPAKSQVTFTEKKINLAFNENYFTNGYTFKVKEALVQMIEG